MDGYQFKKLRKFGSNIIIQKVKKGISKFKENHAGELLHHLIINKITTNKTASSYLPRKIFLIPNHKNQK